MNNWSFTGNLGKDAEQRFVPNGESVVQFSVAVKSGFGEKETTTWARCAYWGKRGEGVLPYLKQGQQVGIVGEVTMREFTNKEGAKQTSLEVRVSDLTLLGGKKEGGSSQASNTQQPQRQAAKPAQAPSSGFDDGFDDSIPF